MQQIFIFFSCYDERNYSVRLQCAAIASRPCHDRASYVTRSYRIWVTIVPHMCHDRASDFVTSILWVLFRIDYLRKIHGCFKIVLKCFLIV